MINVITALYKTLNLIKDFGASYSSCDASKGYMMIDYKHKRYAVKLVEITNPHEDASKDLDKIQYLL